MKPLTTTQLNRIKIKDLIVAIKQTIDPDKGLGLVRIELLTKMEKSSLDKATDDDLRRIEQLFIASKLNITYPSQHKKTIGKDGQQKVVSIEEIYG